MNDKNINFRDEEIKQIEEAATEEAMMLVAEVAHEANRAYCKSIGDFSQASWKEAPKWQKDSAINGVIFTIKNGDISPEDSHKNWFKHKQESGWVFGEKKDEKLKTHPCMVAYEELPKSQRSKDYIYQAVVKTLISGLQLKD